MAELLCLGVETADNRLRGHFLVDVFLLEVIVDIVGDLLRGLFDRRVEVAGSGVAHFAVDAGGFGHGVEGVHRGVPPTEERLELTAERFAGVIRRAEVPDAVLNCILHRVHDVRGALEHRVSAALGFCEGDGRFPEVVILGHLLALDALDDLVLVVDAHEDDIDLVQPIRGCVGSGGGNFRHVAVSIKIVDAPSMLRRGRAV